MAGQEQMVIVWLGTCYHEINAFLKDSELIGQFYGEQYIPFVRKFHHESHFSPQIWKEYLIQKPSLSWGFNLFGMNRAVNVDHLVM